MSEKLEIKEKDPGLYVPESVKIIEVKDLTKNEKFFKLQYNNGKTLGHDPGQFVQVSMLGIGEAPISVTSPPSNENTFELCVRAVGDVTNKIHQLKEGDNLFIRGPFGHGFEKSLIDEMSGKHLLFIAGGLGYAPLRSLLNKVIKEADKYKKISILYGCKGPNELLYKEELESLKNIGGNIELLITVDKGDDSWTGNKGVITTLIPKIDFNPTETIAVVVGPPIMYKFVLASLIGKEMSKDKIFMSLERRMKCGIGKCGHCKMEGIYVCQEGPVFRYSDVLENEEVF